MELPVIEQVGGQPCFLAVLTVNIWDGGCSRPLSLHTPRLFFDGCALLNLLQTGVCTWLHCFTVLPALRHTNLMLTRALESQTRGEV